MLFRSETPKGLGGNSDSTTETQRTQRVHHERHETHESGYRVTYLPVSRDGLLKLADLEEALRPARSSAERRRDSTTIDLCLALFPWAKFRRHKAAIKLHTLLRLRGGFGMSRRFPQAVA